jgi:hypothetical protein
LFTYTLSDRVSDLIVFFLTKCVTVFGSAGYLIVYPTVAHLQLSPIFEAMGNAEELGNITAESEQGMRLLGYGESYPSCCCAPGQIASPETCALVSTSAEANWQRCPTGWVHDATQCAVPEIVQYSDEQTVAGCHCKNYASCGTNAPWQGHAWCDVQGSRCGWTYTGNVYKKWDYCRIDGRPLQYAEGHSSAANDALATFIPNSFEPSMGPGKDNVFTLGSYVDAKRGLVMAKKSLTNSSICFAGHNVETLSHCAHLCLKEGAPTAKTLSTDGESQQKCVAFAWHRQLHLCVRLPEFAADDAEFTPHLSEWAGDGWQNFVSKYHGDDADAVCPASVILDIGRHGYNIIRDKNNGHLYVQCANDAKEYNGQLYVSRSQKVSCIPSECDHKSSWCFVHNRCRSGMPAWLGGCQRLEQHTCEATGLRDSSLDSTTVNMSTEVDH